MAAGRSISDVLTVVAICAAAVYSLGWIIPYLWTNGQRGRAGGRWLFRVLPPPWWPYWGWGWRAWQRGISVAGTSVWVGMVLAGVVHLFARSYIVGWVALPPMIAGWAVALVIALWARPKKLIPPWARAQSGAIREWSDWWKLRRPGEERG